MGRELIFAKLQPLGKRKRDASNMECIDEVCLGAGNCWPFYVRYFVIAAYRMVQADANPCAIKSEEKTDILAALLMCCPADQTALAKTQGELSYFDPLGTNNNEGKMDERMFKKAMTRLLLEKAGLHWLSDLASLQNGATLLKHQIQGVAKMFLAIRSYMAQERKDLDGTPYAANPQEDFPDERTEEVIDAFINNCNRRAVSVELA